MESKSDEFNQAKGRIVSDIKAVITDGGASNAASRFYRVRLNP